MSEWVTHSLGDITTFAGGFAFPPSRQGKQSGPFPFLKVSDMNLPGNEKVASAAANWVDNDDLKAMRAKIWPAGTVIFPKVGAALLTEKRRILGVEAAFDNNVMGVVAGPLLSSEFLFLLMSIVRLGDIAQHGAVPSVNQGQVSRIDVNLPPPDVQRRIVDVVWAVDSQIDALKQEADDAARAVGPAVDSLLAADSTWHTASLGDVGTFIRGKRFTKAEYTDEGLGCIHYGHVHTHFGPIGTEVFAHLPGEARARLRLAEPGDVVVAATSEDVEGLGKATVWLGEDDVAVHDDCQIFKHTLDPVFATFIFASPAFQVQKVRYAAGSKVTRISGADLSKISVPIPPLAVQKTIGLALAELDAQAMLVRAELDALRTFRSALLAALLSQSVSIPESYDDVLDAAS